MPFGNWGGLTAIVILVVILLLFGAPKLPALSKSIADSLKIFKKEMKDDKKDDDTPSSDTSSESGNDTKKGD